MIIEKYHITISGIPVEIIRKDIKNLHLGVYPPDGRVRVSAPLHLDKEAIRLAVISRVGWIRRKQKSFQEQVRESQREMVSGESHYVEGHRYRLNVVVDKDRKRPVVRLKNKQILEIIVPTKTNRDILEQILERWYRRRLQERIHTLLQKWEKRIGVSVKEVRIRKMKTRWGSCNTEARRIWLNLELAKKPISCQEYIVVHEMVHLKERHHKRRFIELMDQFLPNWRILRDELNRAPLAYAKWEY
ncbi:MAG: M48 family peptidase [Candidatus Schekmanbacteria bacterium]|nr:MAG: M48 family peptidase [Candidatus Schekmanbacteria bacterium]